MSSWTGRIEGAKERRDDAFRAYRTATEKGAPLERLTYLADAYTTAAKEAGRLQEEYLEWMKGEPG